MRETLLYEPHIEDIRRASDTLQGIAERTPLMRSYTYSKRYGAEIWLKREDLQQVRSYKIRGAFNKISSLTHKERAAGVVCASAGNHAQGVAYACELLGIWGTIYMPTPTPRQKVEQVRMFGGDSIEIVLVGDTFDDAYKTAVEDCEKHQRTFVHPFNDEKVIEGQATVGLEIISQQKAPFDYAFVPVGGGGLISGLSTVFHLLSPDTQIVGVEPEGAPSMKTSLEHGELVTLETIDRFIDGAAVRRVGEKAFALCQRYVSDIQTVHEGKVCQTILDLYNKDAMVVEPAGALSLAVLDTYADRIRDKKVVCIVSGSNNDIIRTPEIQERALLYAKLKHYFIVRFPQRSGALKQFVAQILGPEDDITYFEYSKKNNRDRGPAVIGIELKRPENFQPLISRMKEQGFFGDYLNDKPDLFQFLV